jgi:hypothetical protein
MWLLRRPAATAHRPGASAAVQYRRPRPVLIPAILSCCNGYLTMTPSRYSAARSMMPLSRSQCVARRPLRSDRPGAAASSSADGRATTRGPIIDGKRSLCMKQRKEGVVVWRLDELGYAMGVDHVIRYVGSLEECQRRAASLFPTNTRDFQDRALARASRMDR